MGTELLFNSEELYSLIFSLVTNLKVLVVIFSGPKLWSKTKPKSISFFDNDKTKTKQETRN